MWFILGTYNLIFSFIVTNIASINNINLKITFQKIKINLHNLCAIDLLESIMCCIDIILYYDDMMQ